MNKTNFYLRWGCIHTLRLPWCCAMVITLFTDCQAWFLYRACKYTVQVSCVFKHFWDHFGPIWSHMVPYGPIWSHVVPCGPMWSNMVQRTLLKRMKETNSRTLTGPNVRIRVRLAQSILRHNLPQLYHIWALAVTFPLDHQINPPAGDFCSWCTFEATELLAQRLPHLPPPPPPPPQLETRNQKPCGQSPFPIKMSLPSQLLPLLLKNYRLPSSFLGVGG